MRTKIILLLGFFISTLNAATITWTNAAGGSWQTASNWSPNQIPGSADTAIIDVAETYTVTLANNVTVNSIVLGGGAGNPTLSMTTQTVKVNGNMSIQANGIFVMQGGSLEGNITIAPNGQLRFDGSAQKSIYSTTISNNGTVRWNGGNLAIGSTPTTIINNAGTWEINSDDSLFLGIGGPAPEFNNTGVLNKIAGSVTTTFSNLKFSNSGAVTVAVGTINFTSMQGSVFGGMFTANTGATIQLGSGTYTENGASFNGPGTMRMTGGTLTLVNDRMNGLSLNGGDVKVLATFQNAGAITNLTLNGARLIGTNEVSGQLTLASGSLVDALTIRPSGTMTFTSAAQKQLYGLKLLNNGAVKWNGGALAVGDTPTTLITNAGLWEINSDESMFLGIGGPTPQFVNSGTVRKLGGSGTTAFSNLQFNSNGLVEAQAGTIQFNGMVNAILGGTFTALPGATIQLNGGTYTENGAVFNGGGTTRMSAGTLTLVNDAINGLSLNGGDVKVLASFQNAGAITNLTLNGAKLIGTNEVSGQLTLLAGSLADSLTIRPNGTMTFTGTPQKQLYGLKLLNNGTVKWNGGALAVGDTPTTVITNAGLWEINSDESMFLGIGGPTPQFLNSGTVRKLGGSGTTAFSNLQFSSSGLVEAQAGTIQFNGMVNAILGGTFTALPGATIQLNGGTYTENGAVFNGGGTTRMSSGTLTLVNNPISGLTLAGGSVKIAPTFQGGAITNLTINGSTLNGTNEVAGTLTLLGGSLADALTIRAGGTLTFSGSNQKQLYGLRMQNNGTVKWNGGALAVGDTPTTLITNAGLWEINSDESMFLGIGGPAPLFLNQGTVRKIGGSGVTAFSNLRFSNTGAVETQNGTIQFTGMQNASIGGTFTAQPGSTIQYNGGTYTEAGGVFNGGGTLRMISGTLTLVNDRLPGLSLNGGDVRILSTFQAAGAITNLTISGAKLIGTNEVAGTLTVSDGGLEQALTVRAGGTLVFGSAQQKSLYSLGLINHGTVKWEGGNLALGNTPTTLLTNFGLWEINSDANMFLGIGGPTPVFYNYGTVRKIGGSGTTSFSNLRVVNGGPPTPGIFEVQNGTIQFSGGTGSILGGNFNADAGATVVLNGGTYTENGGAFAGGGTLRMASGTVTLVSNILTGLVLNGGNVQIGTNFQAAGAITNLTLNGATLVGTNEVAGTLIVASGNVEGRLTVRAGGTLAFNSNNQKGLYSLILNNNGTVLWQGGNLAIGNTPTTIINNAGLWDASDDSSMFLGIGGPNPLFNNLATGIVRKSAGSQVTSLANLAFNNSGVVESRSGTFRFPNNFSHANGTLRLNGGRIEASGTLTFASGILEGSGTMGTTDFTGGTISPGLNGPGKINFASGLKLGSGVTVSIDAANATPGTGYDQLAVTGAVNLGGASLQISALAQVVTGTRFTIIDNDGADAITSTFNGYPEGWLFSNSLQLFRIRYATGTGNDVAIIRDDGGVRLTPIGIQANGSFLLSGLGTNFGVYAISATTNFTNWTELGTTTANSGGIFQFFDTNNAQFPFRFYRSLGPGLVVP